MTESKKSMEKAAFEELVQGAFPPSDKLRRSILEHSETLRHSDDLVSLLHQGPIATGRQRREVSRAIDQHKQAEKELKRIEAVQQRLRKLRDEVATVDKMPEGGERSATTVATTSDDDTAAEAPLVELKHRSQTKRSSTADD